MEGASYSGIYGNFDGNGDDDLINISHNPNPKCYLFNICIFNLSQQEEWCKNQWSKEDGQLRQIGCPEDKEWI